MSPPYQPGDTVTLTAPFRVAGVLTDPTAVSLTVRDPDGTETTYTYPATVTKDSTGIYSKILQVTDPGMYAWTWVGTGTAAGVDEGTFTVRRTLLGAPLLASVDDVKEEMEDGSSTASDDLILRLLGAASKAIPVWCGREFVPSVANPATHLIDVGPYARVAGTTGIAIGDLSAAPTAVLVVDAYGDTVHTFTVASDVVALPLSRRPWEPVTHLRIRPGTTTLQSGYLLSVTGSWGWPMVPDDVAHACVVTVRSWMRSDAQGVSDYGDAFGRSVGSVPAGGWMLPMAAKQLLNPYRYIGVA